MRKVTQKQVTLKGGKPEDVRTGQLAAALRDEA